MQDIYIGQMLDNRYEILEKIGTGGMAIVYKARCHRLNRLVAIKILKDELAQDVDFRKRFYAESQAVAMLSHPNIVGVYDVSRSNNTDYIVMELIEGITLKQYITHKGKLSWKEALHFSTQIAKAIQHAHSRGIIHRDVKPQNIMLLKDGTVKVADFGIARLLSTQNTIQTEALGSVHYMSPEQAKGDVADARSDIYSVGVAMYEMLTGQLPFEGDSPVSIAIQHISSTPLMPRDVAPDIPTGLEAITMHAMEPSLALRYASVDELLNDLEEFRKNPTITFGFGSELLHMSDEPDSSEETLVAPVDASAVSTEVPDKPSKKKKGEWISSKQLSKDEYIKSKRRSRKTAMLVGLFCIIVAIAALFVFMWNFFLRDLIAPDDVRITITDFVGQNIDSVLENEEYKLHYSFTYEEEYSSEFEAGKIISQDPEGDKQLVVQGDVIPVKLVVSLGEQSFKMPNIINIDYREAIVRLEALKLDLDINIEAAPSDDVTSGYVIEQIPAAEELLVKGGSVYITYSEGPEIITVSMPNVTGLSESQAKARLEDYDLSYDIKYDNDESEIGTVIFQSYQVGDDVPVHSKVTLIISLGPIVVEPPVVDDNSPGGDNTPDSGENPENSDSETENNNTGTEPSQPPTGSNPSGSTEAGT